jgi:hypothetical protein
MLTRFAYRRWGTGTNAQIRSSQPADERERPISPAMICGHSGCCRSLCFALSSLLVVYPRHPHSRHRAQLGGRVMVSEQPFLLRKKDEIKTRRLRRTSNRPGGVRRVATSPTEARPDDCSQSAALQASSRRSNCALNSLGPEAAHIIPSDTGDICADTLFIRDDSRTSRRQARQGMVPPAPGLSQ